MGLPKAFSIVVLYYLGCFIVFDIAGALLVTILPEPGGYRLNGSPGFGSMALYYTVWFVTGILSGAIFTTAGRDSTSNCLLVQKYPIVISAMALLLSAGLIAAFYFFGEMNAHGYYVPGNRYMTYTFFISFLVAHIVLSMVINGKGKYKV
ncbi:MAG: hypothetical protein V4722_09675 [Bacteroidota bacterium]